MATNFYDVSTTGGSVRNEDAVKDLLEEYEFTVEPEFVGNTLKFTEVEKMNVGFGVGDNNEREFFNKLSQYLTEKMEVKSVQTDGHGPLSVWKWVVNPKDSLLPNVTLEQF